MKKRPRAAEEATDMMRNRQLRSVLALGLLGCGAAAAPPSAPPVTPAPKMATVEYALMTTNLGDVVIALDGERAPMSVENFLAYVDDSFYDGTVFHRVISNFMIQGGGFTVDMQKKPTRPGVKNEWQNGLKNVRGTLAMARLGGQPDSGTSQFFINVVDNANLDTPQPDGAAYAVFGKVVAGMDVVDTIRYLPTETKGRYQNVPVNPAVIEKVRRITAEEAAERIEKEKPAATQPAK